MSDTMEPDRELLISHETEAEKQNVVTQSLYVNHTSASHLPRLYAYFSLSQLFLIQHLFIDVARPPRLLFSYHSFFNSFSKPKSERIRDRASPNHIHGWDCFTPSFRSYKLAEWIHRPTYHKVILGSFPLGFG